jgi:hypothetical protein
MKLSVSARIALISLVGCLLFWSLNAVDPRASSGDGPLQPPLEAPSITEGAIPTQAAPDLAPKDVSGEALLAGHFPIAVTGGTSPPAAPNVASLLQFAKGPLPWELQMKEAMARAVDDTAAAKAVFGLLGYLPEEALESAAEQALKRLPDKAWRDVALPFLLNPQAHGRVLSVLFADLMERPDEVSLPSLRQLAGVPLHPLGPFALDNLRLILGDNFKLEDKNWEALLQARKDAALSARSTR